MKGHLLVEHIVEKYITGSDKVRARLDGTKPLVASLTKLVLGDVIKSLDSSRCPYCNRVYRSRKSAVIHVTRYHRDALFSDVNRVVDIYIGLVRMFNRETSSRISIDFNGIHIYGSRRSVANLILNNPSILKKLGLI
jgi:hypothetical protein